jgi:hypothetical protein
METCAWCPTPGGTTYYGLFYGVFREDIPGKKVYTYQYGKDTLAYDYNLNAGDTLRGSVLLVGPPDQVYIQSIDSVLVGTNYHKQFWIGGCTYSLIEGIGSTFGILNPIICPFETGSDLWCFRQNDSVAWSSGPSYYCELITNIGEVQENSSITISENPFTEQTTLKCSQNFNNATFLLFNSSGQLLKQFRNISGSEYQLRRGELKTGMYYLRVFENGKDPVALKLLISK